MGLYHPFKQHTKNWTQLKKSFFLYILKKTAKLEPYRFHVFGELHQVISRHNTAPGASEHFSFSFLLNIFFMLHSMLNASKLWRNRPGKTITVQLQLQSHSTHWRPEKHAISKRNKVTKSIYVSSACHMCTPMCSPLLKTTHRSSNTVNFII